MEIRIIPATVGHAAEIGRAVTMAIGEELAKELAGESHTVEDVQKLFSSLAARTDSQYSYLNSMIAVGEDGQTVGVAVVYDGARLRELRKAFIEEAERSIGLHFDREPEDETDPEEFYLDSLAVWPHFRGRGVGRRLITEAAKLAAEKCKPLGLLVSKENPDARMLYDSIGFVAVGERPFAGEMMHHLVINSSNSASASKLPNNR